LRLGTVTQWAAIAFAALAAILSIFASLDDSADTIAKAVAARGGMDLFGSDFDALISSLIWQGRLNSWAALCSACAVLSQAAALWSERRAR